MSTDRDLNRIVRSWLHEDAHEDADRVLDLVLDELDTTPQRRPSWVARRFPDMNSNIVRLGLAAAAALLVVILGFNYLSGSNTGDNVEPTASPTPGPAALVCPSELPSGDHPLTAGTYCLEESFPVTISVEVPERWSSCSSGAVEQGICQIAYPPLSGVGIGFLIVDNVVADPCGPANELLDPPVGPSVDDLVTAISNLEGFEATAATDVTVDGFHGKQFTVTPPASPEEGCELKTWATANRTNGVGPGESNEMRILDVDGVRVVLATALFPQVTQENLAVLEEVLASIQIEP